MQQYIINAKILTMCENGSIEPQIDDGYLAYENGKIAKLGCMHELSAIPNNAINAAGMVIMPGFIDAHTHIGIIEDSIGFEGDDINEITDPITPHLRSIDAINPCDRCFSEAVDAGVTTVLTGPGSANPISGQFCAMKTYISNDFSIDSMIIKAPAAMKFALGENPKTCYHEKSQTPMTRMASAALIRESLFKAKRYLGDKVAAETDDELDPPDFDMKLEALIPVLKREIKAHFHAHRADDIFTAMRISKEFDLDYVIVHCTSGHTIANVLAKSNVSALCGPFICDRSKPELKDLTPASVGILDAANVQTAIVTDHPVIPIQYLPICATIAYREGLNYDSALKAITIRPAKICGIDDICGSLEVGKVADILIFNADPLSALAKPSVVICGGEIKIDRR